MYYLVMSIDLCALEIYPISNAIITSLAMKFSATLSSIHWDIHSFERIENRMYHVGRYNPKIVKRRSNKWSIRFTGTNLILFRFEILWSNNISKSVLSLRENRNETKDFLFRFPELFSFVFHLYFGDQWSSVGKYCMIQRVFQSKEEKYFYQLNWSNVLCDFVSSDWNWLEIPPHFGLSHDKFIYLSK